MLKFLWDPQYYYFGAKIILPWLIMLKLKASDKKGGHIGNWLKWLLCDASDMSIVSGTLKTVHFDTKIVILWWRMPMLWAFIKSGGHFGKKGGHIENWLKWLLCEASDMSIVSGTLKTVHFDTKIVILWWRMPMLWAFIKKWRPFWKNVHNSHQRWMLKWIHIQNYSVGSKVWVWQVSCF